MSGAIDAIGNVASGVVDTIGSVIGSVANPVVNNVVAPVVDTVTKAADPAMKTITNIADKALPIAAKMAAANMIAGGIGDAIGAAASAASGASSGANVLNAAQVKTLLDAGQSASDIANWASNAGYTLDAAGATALAASQGNALSNLINAVRGSGSTNLSKAITNQITNPIQSTKPSASPNIPGLGLYPSGLSGKSVPATGGLNIPGLGLNTTSPGGILDASQVQTMLNAGFTPTDITSWAGSSGYTLDSTGASALAQSQGLNLIDILANLPSTGAGNTASKNPVVDFIRNAFTPSAAGSASNALGAFASGATSLAGAKLAADAANRATDAQVAANREALAQQKNIFDIGQANQAPWVNAGKTALGYQLDLMGLPGGTTGNYKDQLSALQSSPGYQWRLDQGRRALDAGLSARGGMGSGKAATGIADWNQNFASNEYGNRLAQLSGLSDTGQAAASGMAGQGANYANNAANLISNTGGVQGTGTLAATSALQSGLTGAGNALSNYLNPQINNQSTLYRFG